MLNTPLLTEQSIDNINNILKYLYDSHKGYNESSKDVEDPILKTQFALTATNRQKMIDQLQGYVLSDIAKPVEHGTVLGAAHRMFVDLKSLIAGKDTNAIIHEVIRGENILIQKYQLALTEVGASPVKNTLESQLADVKVDLARWISISDDIVPHA